MNSSYEVSTEQPKKLVLNTEQRTVQLGEHLRFSKVSNTANSWKLTKHLFDGPQELVFNLVIWWVGNEVTISCLIGVSLASAVLIKFCLFVVGVGSKAWRLELGLERSLKKLGQIISKKAIC